MKRKFIVVSLFLLLALSISFTACSNSKKSNTNTNTNTSTSNSNKTFTVEELKKYNGKNGSPAYAAVDGTVYDVTNARKWRNGEHEEGITAGKDLTSEMGKAPHGKEVLEGLPIVGKLK